MSVDAQRIMDFIPYAHSLWSAPFQIVIALYFLYNVLGWSVFSGFAVMILMIPINMVIASLIRKFQVGQDSTHVQCTAHCSIVMYMYLDVEVVHIQCITVISLSLSVSLSLSPSLPLLRLDK